jgi:hypothetical protein
MGQIAYFIAFASVREQLWPMLSPRLFTFRAREDLNS